MNTPQIFIAPRSGKQSAENFQKTIEGGYKKSDIEVFLSEDDKEALKDNYQLTYIFDAKYRLSDDKNSTDYPPNDAINQMHRYRDAIYYVNRQEDERAEKEVIGAYVLFPGNNNREEIEKADYYQSIEKINIGAFALLPGNAEGRSLLKEHLQNIITSATDDILQTVSPQKQTKYEHPNPVVLIGIIPTKDQQHHCFEEAASPFYYTGKKTPSRFGTKTLSYFAPYIKGKGIREYYEILGYEILQRNEIFPPNHPLYKNSNEERLIIHLGKKYPIHNTSGYCTLVNPTGKTIPPRTYLYTTLSNIRQPQNGRITLLTK